MREFTAKKGDVLLWYGRLMHRGSPPRAEGSRRPGLIGHYAPIFERRRGYFAQTPTQEHFICPPHKIGTLKAERSE
ncbi:phytanoyl-CoA dioxygenase family protein [Rhodobacteraceae bacterium N5(2021)]|uniref:Phytanoyl-CoA dioxygenase family protein n=1 Tax=Gymnodinialimonas phycosphaerae TaxID=2841589 RepID=A0A975YGT3_9RHOB|nr:phytanoyl-CoA dioxygenase family protein [Gymnodinialimonas phycosphaerae]MBY4892061.1 phytanoyl-CoA dioxygenase family protein [Gymnodinialimonas phycosphaerae]